MVLCVCSAVMCLVLGFIGSALAGSVILNSNSIKSIPSVAGAGHPVSASPDEFSFDAGSQNLAIDSIQSLSCAADEECGDHGFCYASRGACLPCKRRRKRCTRNAMCCPGNQCSNGVCLPLDPDMVPQIGVEDLVPVGTMQEDNSTAEFTSRTSTQDATPRAGVEGESCLRSSNCSEGLCCARHFWSKICKPVLKEGQVCTKHKRKAAHGLEIFQRCDCGEELACRTQRGPGEHSSSKAARSLHTCQRP
ncbi:dickkopf-related protein 1b [Osmerus mordax]|uniref:dickkopf-related protein 1b n=1 Tax=Osmerus mordax TaxID=8014 RepID=UPI00351042C9